MRHESVVRGVATVLSGIQALRYAATRYAGAFGGLDPACARPRLAFRAAAARAAAPAGTSPETWKVLPMSPV